MVTQTTWPLRVTAEDGTVYRLVPVRETCGRGHQLTPDNVYTAPGDGARRCRECKRETVRRRDARRRGRAHAESTG